MFLLRATRRIFATQRAQYAPKANCDAKGVGEGDEEGGQAAKRRSSAGQGAHCSAQTSPEDLSKLPVEEREQFVDRGYGYVVCIPCTWAKKGKEQVFSLRKRDGITSHLGTKPRKLNAQQQKA